MDINSLNRLLGNIDIYLLDQILKGRFTKEMKILDAGCGEGRNTIYFLQGGYQIFGVDSNPIAIQMARIYAQTIQKDYDVFRFQTSLVGNMPFHKGAFDVVISSAVMHFATSETHFLTMMDDMMSVLKPGGIFFLRMTTGQGEMQEKSPHLGDGVYLLPDGSERFLLTDSLEKEIVSKYKLQYIEPAKSVLVHGQRAMGVFVWEKG
ncbi:methyltransferase domain-containing protein [Aquiflexum gelatinilyticum]|uniref:methyltransferase domain-containing protein n=1 Tax=Aquiflexum gelatinilyticum TaxID=2961943 RepID=UPI002167ED73|nr:methyltransferase domain-containing protein [Aquiflexum gelatinilyticum]MCS4433788.1 methyltransferase domain-containing protein [Aquiflexum gelatinilyticum]